MKITEMNFLPYFEKYKTTVYSMAFSYVGNSSDANDILKEVFIKLLKSENDFESDEHLKAWLIRISADMSMNYENKQEDPKDTNPENLTEENKTHNDYIPKLVSGLPKEYRIPLHLYYYEDYSVNKIATVLDLPEAMVRIRLKEGKNMLKAL